MSATFDLNTAAFERQVAELINVTRRDSAEVLKQEAKLFVRDVVKHTPPFGKAPATESFNEQKKAGEAAVDRDIRRAFLPLSRFGKGREDHVVEELKKLARQGRISAAQKMLKDLTGRDWEVFMTVEPQVHEMLRKRGRVNRQRQPKIILKEASLRKFLAEKKKHVGKAKGGWAAAAAALGVKLPNWITKHGSPGSVQNQLNHATAPQITVSNLVGYIQGAGAELRIISRALESRTVAMKAKLEKILAAKFAKGK
jgi:hypothetical protein